MQSKRYIGEALTSQTCRGLCVQEGVKQLETFSKSARALERDVHQVLPVLGSVMLSLDSRSDMLSSEDQWRIITEGPAKDNMAGAAVGAVCFASGSCARDRDAGQE